ncbi:MAG: hypothetical protein LUH05_02060, partial [Candidatus Gastranaerophilales bacterium]|nr:hypothetical protein [Candidatus Gastranaerophilales bacterium]
MNTYSQKITELEAERLKKEYSLEGAVFDVVQYSRWRAKTSAFQAIYYTSGKLLIQGRDIDSIVSKTESILGIKNTKERISASTSDFVPHSAAGSPLQSKNSSNSSAASISFYDSSVDKYIGTDESGKGDFFGPLVAAGVQVDNSIKQKFFDWGIKDSKKLDDKKILLLADKIK